MSTASRYHLHFDAGTEHVLPLSFVDEFGQALDVSCYEVSGVVLQQGKRLPVKAARPSATTAVISFPVLSSGVANYRLDMTSPAGTEIPMVFGTIHVMARETEASGTGELDALEVAIPTVSEQDVTIKVLGVLDLAEFGAGIEKSVEELKAGLAEHAKNARVHASAEEKAAWNAKLSPAAADERYGFAGSIPGQEVNGQSFSTNLYLIGNRIFAKKADFANEALENMVLSLNVDDKIVSFNDATVVMNGMADINVLYVNKLNTQNIYTGEIECQKATGSFVGSLTGEMLFADRYFNQFNQPGFRGDASAQTVSFGGVRQAGGVAKSTPLTIHYAPDNQKVDVAHLEVKGQTVLNPSSENDEVLLATFKANDAARYELRLRKSDGALRLTLPGGGASIFSCNSTGKMFALQGFDVKGDFTAQSATFSGYVVVNGDVTTSTGIHALPLGKKTALGADAYGLSVSADGGLQLWGTHFMQGSIWGENGLKVVQNEVSLTSTESAAIGFDYANIVHFRTMPNDGDGHGVYRFECWKWEDDSHTQKVLGACDVQKNNASQLNSTSLLNLSELNDYFLRKNFGIDQYVDSFVTFLNGVGTDYLSVGNVGLIEGRVNGGVQALQLGKSLTTGNPEYGLSVVDVWATGEVRCLLDWTYLRMFVSSSSETGYLSKIMANVPFSIDAPEVYISDLRVDELGLGGISFDAPGTRIYIGSSDGHLKISGLGIDLITSDTDVLFNGKTLDEIVEEKVNAILAEKGLI